MQMISSYLPEPSTLVYARAVGVELFGLGLAYLGYQKVLNDVSALQGPGQMLLGGLIIHFESMGVAGRLAEVQSVAERNFSRVCEKATALNQTVAALRA